MSSTMSSFGVVKVVGFTAIVLSFSSGDAGRGGCLKISHFYDSGYWDFSVYEESIRLSMIGVLSPCHQKLMLEVSSLCKFGNW
ncbi:hypothetical protein DITRI_Ditri07aG0139900 [Diplodiscus trichospermus]